MKYNGIKLIEMHPGNWDGKSRKMLVWTDASNPAYKDVCYIKTVIGYNSRKCAWVVDDKGLVHWPHCAEIPTEEKEDVMKLLIDNENEILELRQENDDLKARIKSLRVERGKMANAVSGAVWKELMTRAKNNNDLIIITPEGGPGKVGFGFNDIADLVRNKIIDYESENPSDKKFRKMTYKELSEWLAKGNGQYKNGNFGSFRTELVYCKNEENTIVDNDCLIRGFNETEWHEPLIEEE